MKFNLLSRAALGALVGASDAGTTVIVAGGEAPVPADPVEPVDPAEGDPQPENPPAPAPAAPESQTDAAQLVVTVADAAALAAEARAAEVARTATVFASDEALANPQMAAWMLSNSPNASAESIITQLKTLPAGSTAAATPPVRTIADTEIDLGRGDPNAALGLGANEGDDPWASSNKRVFGNATPADIVVPAGMTVGASDGGNSFFPVAAGLSLSTPTAGVRPTGN